MDSELIGFKLSMGKHMNKLIEDSLLKFLR
jgi:hypothetical protein